MASPQSSPSASPKSSTSLNSTSDENSTRFITTALVHAPATPSARPAAQARRALMRRRAEIRRHRRHTIVTNALESIVEEHESLGSGSASTTPSLPPRFSTSPILPPRPLKLRNRSISMPDPLLATPQAAHVPERPVRSRSAPRLTITEKKRPHNEDLNVIKVLSSSAPDLYSVQEMAKVSERISRSEETGKKKHKSRLRQLKTMLPRQNDRLRNWFRSLFAPDRSLDRHNIGLLHSNARIVSAPDILDSLANETNATTSTPENNVPRPPPTPPSVSLMNFYRDEMQNQEAVQGGKSKDAKAKKEKRPSIVIELSAAEQRTLAREFAKKGALNGRPPSHSLRRTASANTATAKGKVEKKNPKKLSRSKENPNSAEKKKKGKKREQ